MLAKEMTLFAAPVILTWGCKAPQANNPLLVGEFWQRALPFLVAGASPGMQRAVLCSPSSRSILEDYNEKHSLVSYFDGLKIPVYSSTEVRLSLLTKEFDYIILLGGGNFLEPYWRGVKFKYIRYMDGEGCNIPITADLKFSEANSKRIITNENTKNEFFYQEV
jgi:hypothetical protein